MKHHFPIRTVLALAAALVLWSSAFAGIRVGLTAYPPAQLALLRFLVASLTLAVYASLAHFRRPQLRDLPRLALTGALGITFYNIALNYGELTVSAGAASLLIASAPIWTALLATVALHERLTILGWGGVFISFAGVAVIAIGEGGGFRLSIHALLIVGASIAAAIYIVMQKELLRRLSALEFTAYSIWFGTLFMIPFGLGLPQTLATAPHRPTLAIVYLGIFPGALAYVAWSYVMTHGPASSTASYLYLNPVLAVAIAWVWLGEIPRAMSLIGGVVALAGVVIVNFWGHLPAAEPKRVPLEV